MAQATTIADCYQTGSSREAYVLHRIEGQISYYERKSSIYKKRYFRFSIATIVLNAMIPILSLFLPDANLVPKMIITVISSITTILTGVLAITGTKELWMRYRTNASGLTATLHQYYAQTGIFAGKTPEEAFLLMSSVCEAQMQDEYKQWDQILSQSNSKP